MSHHMLQPHHSLDPHLAGHIRRNITEALSAAITAYRDGNKVVLSRNIGRASGLISCYQHSHLTAPLVLDLVDDLEQFVHEIAKGPSTKDADLIARMFPKEHRP